MDNDDRLIGHVLSRRELLQLVTIGGVTSLGLAPSPTFANQVATPLPGCVVRPELEEGPFFVDARLNRSDIRTDPAVGTSSQGVPLTLAFALSQITAGACTALPGATVDIWHCDAAGLYSGVSDPGQAGSRTGNAFLRGFQTTDANGHARFTTIYPGWYRGRAVHVHFKIRTSAPAGAYEFTSQLFFDDTLTDEVHARAPYASHGRRGTFNRTDGIFRTSGGQMTLTVSRQGQTFTAAPFTVGLDLSNTAIGQSDGRRGGRGPGGPGRGRG